MLVPNIVSGQAVGTCIAVANSTDLAALPPQGIALGTTVYNIGVGAYFILTASNASLVPDQVVAVQGITGQRWVIQSVAGVTSVTAGLGISVDNSSPAAPVVAATTGTLVGSGASALTNWTFAATGINGDTDGDYAVEGALIAPAAIGGLYSLSFNANSAPAGITGLGNRISNAGVVAAAGPNNGLGLGSDPVGSGGGTLTFRGTLSSKSGRTRIWTCTSMYVDSGGNYYEYTFSSQIAASTSTVITDLRILCDTANGIGANSFVRWKKLGFTA